MLEGWGPQRGAQLPPASQRKAGLTISFSAESRGKRMQSSTEQCSQCEGIERLASSSS